MTALAANKALNREVWNDHTFTLKSGENVFKGALIAFELGTAFVVEATGASDELVIGTAMEAVNATAAAKSIAVRLEREVNILYLANGSSIATANQGQLCYVTDDQTVSLTPIAAGASLAGRIWTVDSVRGVGVELIAGLTTGGAILSQTALPAHAANDVILTAALAVPGSIYDIATTAGASTVTLPAGVAEGTELTFVADGTKNGHTVQYRDATGPTNLTTALTASKRHMVIAVFLNGIWNANAYVSP
jgi:hypothetical protein